jgi:hypothetical protein
MDITKDDLDDYFSSITFHAPKSLCEMRAWYEVYKGVNIMYSLNFVFETLGISYKKIQSFKTKMDKGFTKKELEFIKCFKEENDLPIRYILSKFDNKPNYII